MDESTLRAPDVPVKSFKRTKIIATLGPATNSYEAILGLMKAGANGLRLNFSHGNEAERDQQIKWIRKAGKEHGKPVAIIADLQGPKIRLGDFEGIINIQKGRTYTLKFNADFARSGHLPTQYDLSTKVKRGHRLHIFDGKIQTVISSIKDGVVYVEAQNDGILISRKGINVPDTDFGGDVLTKKDLQDIAWSAAHDIDWVALSFVQTVADVHELRAKLQNQNSDARVIAKIETKAALDNLEQIIEEADAVMIARGDLAVETAIEQVPVIQQKIIGLCLVHSKPSIVATQMLSSMVEAPEPLRAEASDVANAVINGTDCLMLSEETANGLRPLDVITVMKKIVKHTETNALISTPIISNEESVQNAISKAVINLADTVKATAIVAETKSGATALAISSKRPSTPVIAVTSSQRTAQQLSIAFGIKSYVRPAEKFAATRLTNWMLRNRVLKRGDIVVTASGKYPGVVGTTDTIKVRIL